MIRGLFLFFMRYHYISPILYSSQHGRLYICDHPLYSRCILYERDGIGLAIVQQRFNPKSKRTWWDAIDPWLVDELYFHPEFDSYFKLRAKAPEEGLYPTVSVRQVMWALRMKPLPRQRWETVFDRKEL